MSQPTTRAPTKAGQKVPYPVIRGQSGETFQVLDLDLTFSPVLFVGGIQPDSDGEESQSDLDGEGAQSDPEDEGDTEAGPESHVVSSGAAEFAARVRFTGATKWKIGWLQTCEPAENWVLYEQGDRAARHCRTLEMRMKDGDSEGCWYGKEARRQARHRAAVSVQMSDDPNISFCWPVHPGGHGFEALEGLSPTECGGTKDFWAWLVAVRDDQPQEMVFLHYINWQAAYTCQLQDDHGEPKVTFGPGSGAVLLSEGTGPGGVTPVLTGPPPRPRHEISTVKPR